MLPARFWDKTKPEGGCLVWTGTRTRYGYGQFRQGTMRFAHRLAYQDVRGPIPAGLQLDHLCRNRACVKPSHLEPVTNRENSLRGFGASGINARKDKCIHGHPFDGTNTYRHGVRRQCRACRAERMRRYRNGGLPK